MFWDYSPKKRSENRYVKLGKQVGDCSPAVKGSTWTLVSSARSYVYENAIRALTPEFLLSEK